MDTEVTAEVAPERGRWVVYLVVTTPEGVDRRAVQTYPDERTARLMAETVRRTAARRREPREDPGD